MTARWWAVVAFAVLLVALAAAVWRCWCRGTGRRRRAPTSSPRSPTCRPSRSPGAGSSAPRCGRAATAAWRSAWSSALVLGLTPLGARLVELVGRPFGDHWVAQARARRPRRGARRRPGDAAVRRLAAAVLARYGLSTQGWGGWAVDLLKGYAVSAVIGVVALLGFYTVVRLAPRWWWALGAVGAAALVVLLDVRAAGAGRAGVQQVHPDGARPAAHRADGDGRARRRAGARRAGRRRVAAHPGGQRVRLRARPDPADRRLRHAAARGAAGRGDRRRRARAGPRQGPRRVRRHADRRARRRRSRWSRSTCSASWSGAAARGPASTRSPSRARSRCWSPSSTVAGLVVRAGAGAGVPAGRGARRRARAGADRRPGDVRVDAAPAGRGQPRRPRPAALGVPVRRSHPSTVERMAAARAYAAGRLRRDPHAAGHQRLPAPARRHPGVRAQARGPAAGRARWWSTRRPGAGAAKFDAEQPFEVVRERTDGAAAHPGGRPAGGASSPGRTAATRCGSARRRRSGCSPPGCGGGPASAGRWRRPTATRSAGRRCPAPGALLRAHRPRASTSSPTWASTPASGSTGCCTA